MNKTTPIRFNASGFAIGVGVTVALAAALGPTIGVPTGLGLAVVFGLTPARKC